MYNSLLLDAELVNFIMIWYLIFLLEQHHPMVFWIIRVFVYDMIVFQSVFSQCHYPKSCVINYICGSEFFIWRVSLDDLPIISCNTLHNRQQSVVQVVFVTSFNPVIRRLNLNKSLVVIVRVYPLICMIMTSYVQGHIVFHHF